MTIIFKALTGFGEGREIFFPAQDLEKVQYAFLREKRVLLSNGQAVDGKFIQQISPDWLRTMGWNTEHSLDADDMNEIKLKGIEENAYRFMEKSRERVHYLLSSNREQEIGSDIPIPELERPVVERREGKMIGMNEILKKKQ